MRLFFCSLKCAYTKLEIKNDEKQQLNGNGATAFEWKDIKLSYFCIQTKTKKMKKWRNKKKTLCERSFGCCFLVLQ